MSLLDRMQLRLDRALALPDKIVLEIGNRADIAQVTGKWEEYKSNEPPEEWDLMMNQFTSINNASALYITPNLSKPQEQWISMIGQCKGGCQRRCIWEKCGAENCDYEICYACDTKLHDLLECSDCGLRLHKGHGWLVVQCPVSSGCPCANTFWCCSDMCERSIHKVDAALPYLICKPCLCRICQDNNCCNCSQLNNPCLIETDVCVNCKFTQK